jgi:opacity protein-like surface antigen
MGDVQNETYTYLGGFGGGGTLSSLSLTQLGSAYFSDASGGPLAVNAFGESLSRAEWLVGAHVGHTFSSIPLSFLAKMSLQPALELEGYYIGKNSIHGNDINNSTTRLSEHDFSITYPTSIGAGLLNAVIYFNHQTSAWQPYVAGGVGIGLVSISNAISTQTSPYEPGINHYNSASSASDSALMSQAKVGLNFNWTPHMSLFGEYRYIYVAPTAFTFGSTVYTTHRATSNWDVQLGEQSYNMGVIGVRYMF